MPRRVLLFIQHLDQGGTEHHLYDLVRGLDRARWQPQVVFSTAGVVSNKLAAEGERVTQLPIKRINDKSALAALAALRRLLRRERIDVLVTFHFVADLLGTLAALGTRTRVISSRRDMGFTRTPKQKALGHWIDKGTRRYIAVSDAVRQAVARDERVAASKIDVIHNGIDAAALDRQQWDLAAERARHGIEPGDLLLGCVANFNPVKGHLTLIEAFAQLVRSSSRPAKLMLAGDGPMRAEIEAAIARHGLEGRVILLGLSSAVAREFQMSDIVVLPSDTEGFSNAIVQGMYYGKPVVACRVGGNPEAIVQGETGLLVEPKQPAQMAEAFLQLAGDDALRARMGQAGHARACELFTLDAMLTRTQALFDAVCAR